MVIEEEDVVEVEEAIEVVVVVEAAVVDKKKMQKEETITIHAVEDEAEAETVEQIGTILNVTIVVNMVTMQTNVMPKKRWRRMPILSQRRRPKIMINIRKPTIRGGIWRS